MMPCGGRCRWRRNASIRRSSPNSSPASLTIRLSHRYRLREYPPSGGFVRPSGNPNRGTAPVQRSWIRAVPECCRSGGEELGGGHNSHIATVAVRHHIRVRFIERGGMGEVYEAEDLKGGGSVALKMIRREIASDN